MPAKKKTADQPASVSYSQKTAPTGKDEVAAVKAKVTKLEHRIDALVASLGAHIGVSLED